MNDYIKDIENKDIKNHYNWTIEDSYFNDFNEKIERSFQDFIDSEEFKNTQDDANIKDKFNLRLDAQLNILEDTKDDNIAKTVIWPITFELNSQYTRADLMSLENIINKEDTRILDVPVEVNQIFDKIDKTEKFNPDNEPELKDFIQKWERFGAIKEIFKILWRFFKVENETWLKEYWDLWEEMAWLQLDVKTEEELKNLIKNFENKILETWDIKKDLKLTFILSKIKDKLLLKDNSSLKPIDLLAWNLQEWDVILLNKKVEKIDSWSKALKAYDSKYETDFVHSAIVIWTNPIMIRHSTSFTAQKTGKWHVEETNLVDYLKIAWTKSFDLLSLRPDEATKDKILNFSKANLNKEYDNNAALWWGIRWVDSDWNSSWWWLRKNKTWKKDDSFNCVEIIAQALDQEKLQNITHPNEFLEYMDTFQPIYLTSIAV